MGSIQPCKRGLERGRNRKITWQKLLVRKDSHKAQMCMPLKPATTRDCGGGVQFNAEITGISIMQKVGEDRSWYVLPEEDIIRKKGKML